jgi:Glyoxalase-like domain
MTAPALDHVGVVANDLVALTTAYERLGFTLTPLARYADGRIGNRCVMLRSAYIELLAVVDPNARSATLERFLARYAGIHILAFAIADEQSAVERLRRAGIEQATVNRFARPFDDADPGGQKAEFVLIQTPEQPEGRVNLVRHLTRNVLWQEPFIRHVNNAIVLEDVCIAVAEPADAAARLSRLVGSVVVPDPHGALVLDVSAGRVRLMQGQGVGVVPRIARLTLRTSDSNAMIRRLVSERNIVADHDGDAVLVDAAAAGGVEICFEP